METDGIYLKIMTLHTLEYFSLQEFKREWWDPINPFIIHDRLLLSHVQVHSRQSQQLRAHNCNSWSYSIDGILSPFLLVFPILWQYS